MIALAGGLALAASLATSCTSGPLKNPRIMWNFEAPRETTWSNRGYARTPVITGDTIIYTSGYPWHDKIFLYAVNRTTGKKLWSTKDPVKDFKLVGDAVYTTSLPEFFKSASGQPHDGWIKAFDVATGEELWKVPTITARDPRILSAGKYLYVLGDNQTVVALGLKNGDVAWETKNAGWSINAEGDVIFAEQPDRSIAIADGATNKGKSLIRLTRAENEGPRSLFVSGDKLLVIDPNGYIFSSDIEKRTILGPLEVGVVTSKIIIDGETAFFGSMRPDETASKSQIPSHVTGDGESLPSRVPEIRKPNQPAFARAGDKKVENEKDNERSKDEKNEAKTSNSKYFLNCLDLNSGKLAWRKETPASIMVGPVLGDGAVFAGTDKTRNLFFSFDAKTGDVRWETSCKDATAGATYNEGAVYLTSGRKLLALDAASGNELWSIEVQKYATTGNPVVSGDAILFVAEDSNLYAVKKATPQDFKAAGKTASTAQTAAKPVRSDPKKQVVEKPESSAAKSDTANVTPLIKPAKIQKQD